MEPGDLITTAANTWCPGCGNFGIEHTLKDVIAGLIAGGTPAERIVLVTGIGCHGKMADYLGVNSFYAIHGRTLPVATGLKVANPDLTVLVCAGDGDCYGEGLEHLLFAAKRNVDITLLVHDNRVYGLTTGQYTPTSPLGFPGRSTPLGTPEYPLNPVELMIAAGATWVARGYSRRLPQLHELIRAGIAPPRVLVPRGPPDLRDLLQPVEVLRRARLRPRGRAVPDGRPRRGPPRRARVGLQPRVADPARGRSSRRPTRRSRSGSPGSGRRRRDPVGVMQRLIAERT